MRIRVDLTQFEVKIDTHLTVSLSISLLGELKNDAE